MSEQAACAHRIISYRTEPVDEEKPHGYIRGWWECDSECGTKFSPIIEPTAVDRLKQGYEKIAESKRVVMAQDRHGRQRSAFDR